jgi:dynein light intermediate chain
MTLAAYQTLYHGSVIFGIRKQLQAEQGRAELENKIEDFGKRKIYLENRVGIPFVI